MKKALLFSSLLIFVFGATIFTGCNKEDDEKLLLKPKAGFSYEIQDQFAPAKVKFTNESTDATTYSWNFGDVSPSSTTKNPTHIFESGGTYEVSLKAEGPGGIDIMYKTIKIKAPPPEPYVLFSYKIDDVFAPSKVTFTNLSQFATSYRWDFGDGSSVSNSVNPIHTYNEGGTYTVTLTAQGEGGVKSFTSTIEIFDKIDDLSIVGLELLDYPQTTDNGWDWDLFSGPDIYWKIMDKSMTTTYFTGGVINDANYGNLPFTYNSGLPYFISNLDKKYVIAFYDEDSSDSEFMGGYYFTPSEWSEHPYILHFYSSLSELEFDLYVFWLNKDGQTISNNKSRISVELKPLNL